MRLPFTFDGVPTDSLLYSVGRDRHLLRSRNLLADLTARLGLSSACAAEVAALTSDVTDGDHSDDQLFPVLDAPPPSRPSPLPRLLCLRIVLLTFTSDSVPTDSLLYSVGDFNYRDRLLLRSRNLLADLAAHLGLSFALAFDVTDRDLGDGQWLPVLGAPPPCPLPRRGRCRARHPFSLAEVAAVVGCEVYNLGRMTCRVAHHLRLPRFRSWIPSAPSSTCTVRTSPSFAEIESQKAEQVIGQGRFLLQ